MLVMKPSHKETSFCLFKKCNAVLLFVTRARCSRTCGGIVIATEQFAKPDHKTLFWLMAKLVST